MGLGVRRTLVLLVLSAATLSEYVTSPITEDLPLARPRLGEAYLTEALLWSQGAGDCTLP